MAAGKRSDGLLAGEDDCCVVWAAVGDGERDGLNVALNEATWAGIGVDAAGRRARLLLGVLSLPADGAVAVGRPVAVAVNRVSRIAASLRMGWWDDTAADVIPLGLGDLDAIVGGAARRRPEAKRGQVGTAGKYRNRPGRSGTRVHSPGQ